ncbi:hypothetical protein [Pueribacillus sp. YX66]
MEQKNQKKQGLFAKIVIIALLILVTYVTGYYVWAAIDFYL